MKMDTNPIVLLFFYGLLWRSYLSAEIKGPTNSSLPPTFQVSATVGVGPTTQPFRYSTPTTKLRDTTKNEGQTASTTIPTVTVAQENKLHDGHLIAAVVIGIILLGMIVVIVGIFLCKRLKTTALVDPHWAGRSPFADGDMLEITADKEPMQNPKRASVLSLLPWKFNKNTLLLENAEGQLSESGQSLDAPTAHRDGKRDSLSSPTATENSVSSTSLQTPVSDGPSSLIDIPLQSDGLLLEPADFPPLPSEVCKDLCPNGPASPPFQLAAETPCSVPPDFSQGNPDLESSLPPPPEDFF